MDRGTGMRRASLRSRGITAWLLPLLFACSAGRAPSCPLSRASTADDLGTNAQQPVAGAALQRGSYYVVDSFSLPPQAELSLNALRLATWRFRRSNARLDETCLQASGALQQDPNWARYTYELHLRVHPAFTDQFLASLQGAETPSELQDQNLETWIDVQVDGSTGRVKRIGFEAPGGSTLAFTLAAIASVQRAAELRPPAAHRSSDGDLYFRWTFFRDPERACSTFFLRHASGLARG